LIILGMIFLALYNYVVWIYRDAALVIRQEKTNLMRGIIGYINAFGILVVVILMLQIGSNVPWFNYYIVQQSGIPPINILNIIFIPNVYIKVVSISLSSLVAFSLTVYLDLKKNLKDLMTYEKQNVNISSIIYTKEEFIKKQNGRTNIKVLVFLALLGFALIPYSDDGFFNILPIGLLLILPCVLVFLIFFMIGYIQKYEGVSKPFIFESTKKCQDCGTENTNSALFCRQCKIKIGTNQTLFGETITCQPCDSINPIGSKFCMKCGSEFIEKQNKNTNLVK